MSSYVMAREHTKVRIFFAFWELWKKYDISQISVTKTANICNIHRGTFYLYYKDIYDVLDELEEYLLQTFHDSFEENAGNYEDHLLYVKFCQELWLSKDREFLQTLIFEDKDPRFSKIYRQEMKRQFLIIHNLIMPQAGTKQYFIYDTLLDIYANVLIRWLSEQPFDAEEAFQCLFCDIIAYFNTTIAKSEQMAGTYEESKPANSYNNYLLSSCCPYPAIKTEKEKMSQQLARLEQM